MSPEAQRIAIAEACGWKCQERVPFDLRPNAVLCWYPQGKNEWETQELPDYLNDLNAMHEAEKILNEDQMIKYLHSHLRQVCGGHSRVRATASQRSEAFLKTIGKWQPSTEQKD